MTFSGLRARQDLEKPAPAGFFAPRPSQRLWRCVQSVHLQLQFRKPNLPLAPAQRRDFERSDIA